MLQITEFIANHLVLISLFTVVACAWMLFELKTRASSINHSQAINMLNRDLAVVLDLRTPEAFAKGHITNSYNLPENNALADIGQCIQHHKDKSIILVSASGSVPGTLVQEIRKAGSTALSLAGGIATWTQENLPLVTKKEQKEINKKIKHDKHQVNAASTT
jgi:rhodanese-related sulfurtransferase